MPDPLPATYSNPVWDADFADPTVLLAPDGYYYAYGTQTKRAGAAINLQVMRSRSLVAWDYLGEGLPVKPAWAATTQRFWAPHVSRIRGRYVLYYTAQPDAGGGLALGVALADAPAGPFVDVGRPLLAGAGFRDIDPMAFADPATGQLLLYWGSGFGPLQVQALTADGLAFAPGSAATPLLHPLTKPVAGSYESLLEGAWLHYRAGWYYLFYSGNDCCGPAAHYAVLVARSRAATGPFETRTVPEAGALAPILKRNARWQAPGHNCVVTDAAGTDWLAYHAIDIEQPTFDALNDEQGYSRRVLLLDQLAYADGWPRVIPVSAPTTGPHPAPVV